MTGEHHISAYLDLFVADKRCVPSGACPVLSPTELPRSLQKIAERAPANEGWRAWMSQEGRVFFVRGKVSEVFTRRMHRPAMHVFFHDAEGELMDSGVWAKDMDGRWDPCDIPDARVGRRSAAG